jgi:ribosomal protein L37AE/L43A
MIQSQHHYNRYQRFIGFLRGQSVDGYAEVHHIMPRSLGGSDDADNLIRLTARQHFIAHWMLARALGGAASRAFFMMSNFGKYGQVNSTTYQIARQEYAEQVSKQLTGKPSQCPFSDETKQKMREAKLGRSLREETKQKLRIAMLGQKRGPEFATKVSEAKRGRGNGRIGFVASEETKRRMAEANRNRPIVVCPHCNKSVKDHGGAKRWHFDRCKERKAA